MHPYREPAASRPRSDEGGAPSEEWAIAGLLALLGGVRVAIAVVRGEEAAIDVTVAGVLGLVGLVLLVRLVFSTRS